MPPSEGLKMLVSTMMTGHDVGNHADGPFEMATWDVSRGHFYGEARMWICTYLPEGNEQEGKLARLCRSMYGTRDAASILGDMVSMVSSVEGWLHERTACSAFFFGVSASDAKELKIVNRTIKIDVLKDEMTLEADTKLSKDALETMKLVGAKRRRFATCQAD